VTVSTGLTRARRSQAALVLDPLPASKVQSDPHELRNLTSTTLQPDRRAGWNGCISRALEQ